MSWALAVFMVVWAVFAGRTFGYIIKNHVEMKRERELERLFA